MNSHSVTSNSFATPWSVALPGSSVHGVSQARILEWVDIFVSRESSQPRDQTCFSCLAGGFFTTETPGLGSNKSVWVYLLIHIYINLVALSKIFLSENLTRKQYFQSYSDTFYFFTHLILRRKLCRLWRYLKIIGTQRYFNYSNL